MRPMTSTRPTGRVIEVSETVRGWIDWEAMGRDLASDATEVTTGDGTWLVFG